MKVRETNPKSDLQKYILHISSVAVQDFPINPHRLQTHYVQPVLSAAIRSFHNCSQAQRSAPRPTLAMVLSLHSDSVTSSRSDQHECRFNCTIFTIRPRATRLREENYLMRNNAEPGSQQMEASRVAYKPNLATFSMRSSLPRKWSISARREEEWYSTLHSRLSILLVALDACPVVGLVTEKNALRRGDHQHGSDIPHAAECGATGRQHGSSDVRCSPGRHSRADLHLLAGASENAQTWCVMALGHAKNVTDAQNGFQKSYETPSVRVLPEFGPARIPTAFDGTTFLCCPAIQWLYPGFTIKHSGL